MAKVQGITIALSADASGITEALKEVDKASSKTTTELGQINKALKFDPDNAVLLQQKMEVLGNAINNTTTRLSALKEAQTDLDRQMASGKAVDPAQYRALAREIEQTEGVLRGFKRQFENVDVRLNAQADTTGIDKMKNALKELGPAAKQAASEIGSALSTAGAAGTAAVTGLVVGMSETNKDLAMLETQIGQVGLALEDIGNARTMFDSVGQETDQVTEAMGNLIQAGYQTRDSIEEISASLAGAVVKYGDTFNVEGLAESITTTTQLGEVTGQLTDLLEKEGINVENFNAKIQTMSTEQERANYISQLLADQGLTSLYNKYAEGNSEIVDASAAQISMTDALSQLSTALTPLVTTVSEFVTKIVEWANENQGLATALAIAAGAITGLSGVFAVLSPIVSGIVAMWPALVAAFGAISAPIAIAIAAVTALTTAGIALWKNWDEVSVFLKGVWEGIKSSASSIFSAIATAVSNKMNEVKTNITKKWNEAKSFLQNINLLQIGRDIINGLTRGISEKINSVKAKIEELAGKMPGWAKKVLGIKSPSRVFAEIGRWTGEGITVGLNDELKNVEGATKELAQVMIDAMEGQFGEIQKLEKEQSEKLAKLESDKAEKVKTVQTKAAKEKRKLTADELAKIDKINKDYQTKSLDEERKYTEKLAKLQNDLDKKKLDSVKSFISQKSQLEQLSIVEEAQLWQQALEAFNDNSDAKIEAQIAYRNALEKVYSEITKVNEDYSKQVQKINSDLEKEEKSLTDEYKKAVDDRAKSLINFTSLFEEFDIAIETSGAQLLTNLKSQVDGFKEWQKEIEKLSEKAIDEGLLEELRQMGPKALGELKELNKLSESELTEYSNLYQEKMQLAKEQSVKELDGLKQETDSKIKRLRSNANTELDKLAQDWDKAIKSLVTITQTEGRSLESVGRDIVSGLISGMSGMQVSLEAKVREIAQSIETTTRQTLKTKSPSRVMMEIGKDIANGLIVGMEQRGEAVTDEAREMAKNIAYAFEKGNQINTDFFNSDKLKKDLAEAYNVVIFNKNWADGVNPLNFEEDYQKERLAIKEKYDALMLKVDEETQEQMRPFIEADNYSKENEDQTRYLLKKKYQHEFQVLDEALGKAEQRERLQAQAHEQVLDELFKSQKDYAVKAKKAGALSLARERDLYEEYSKMYSEDSEEFKYFSEEKIRVQKVMTEAITKINNDYTSKIKKANDELVSSTEKLENKYKDTYNGIRNNILSATDGFGEFQRKDKIQGQTLVKNLESQIRAINEYNSVINSLGGRVSDTGFMDYLRTLGPESLSELEAINSLSREELDNYVALYNERFEKASNSATIQLQGMRSDIDQEIATLQQQTATQLDVYQKEWENAIGEITGGVVSEFEELPETMEDTGKSIIKGIQDGLSSMAPALISQVQSIASAISSTIKDALDINGDVSLSGAVSGAIGSLSSSAVKTQAAQVTQQQITNNSSVDMGGLVQAVADLAQRPVNTSVTLDGRVIASAVSSHQYNSASLGALVKGVSL